VSALDNAVASVTGGLLPYSQSEKLQAEAAAELAALRERVQSLEAEKAEAIDAAQQAVKIGVRQAAEWDRFWEAMGVKSADITVDQAIEKYKAMEAAALARGKERG
jgi:hypothetical protein